MYDADAHFFRMCVQDAVCTVQPATERWWMNHPITSLSQPQQT